MWRIRKKEIPYILMFIGVLFYPLLIRNWILPSNIVLFNPWFIIAIVFAIRRLFIEKITKFNIPIVLAFIVMTGINFYSNFEYGYSLLYCFKIPLIMTFPVLFLLYAKDFDLSKETLIKWCSIFNVIVNVIIIFGVVNKISSNAVIEYASTFLSIGDNFDRLWSLYGHPLYNSFLLLLFYSVNYLMNKHSWKKVNMVYIIVCTLLGQLLAASKSGIAIYIMLLIATNFKSVMNTIIEVVVFLATYLMGWFDLIIERFSSGSLTTGRFETLALLSGQSYNKPFMIFHGYGTMYALRTYTKYISWAGAAFEFPILAYSLDYGILYTVLFLIITVGMPTVIMLKNKTYDLLICYGALTLSLHVFNGITIESDICAVYFIVETIFIGISCRGKEKHTK